MITGPKSTAEAPPLPLASSGIEGLDSVLGGGFQPDRLYLVEGVPGSGKTTLAMQFLMEGVRHGEPVLYVTLSETEEELRAVAESHGWSLDGVQIQEVSPSETNLHPDEQYTVFHPSEVELGQATRTILSEVERNNPVRVVFDSLSEVRLLAGTALRYRRQILGLKRYFAGRSCTVLLLDDLTAQERDLQVQSIAHGVLLLEQMYREYGAERRRLRVVKYRGKSFRGGFHDFTIRRGGLEVFPRLVASEHRRSFTAQKLPSGLAALDRLLGGGLDEGTSTLIVGPPGAGKSTMAAQFAAAAAGRGQHAAMFVFDESLHTLLSRSEGLGIDLQKHIDSGLLTVQPVDPAELSPGQFVHIIRSAVERDGAAIVVIDSLNGYLNATPEEKFLTMQLHELLIYLGQLGVATLLIAAQQGLLGPQMTSRIDATYLVDTVVLLRYFEAGGEVRQALSIIKKRAGEHERSIRELRFEENRIRISEPLHAFRGVLTGVPVLEGQSNVVMQREEE